MTSLRLTSPVSQPALPVSAEPCYHGGAFFEAIGSDFQHLDRRHEIINADVLDAWFPPSPRVLEAVAGHLDWLLRTSPPTQCEGLVAAISAARGVEERSLVPGAGSSDLMFRALPRWLTPASRVLILDPTYGEYQHLLEHVVGCEVQRFHLRAADAFHVDPDRLIGRIRKSAPDLVIIVNPNNPTGRHIPRRDLERVIIASPEATRFWIDEAYLDYISADESLERFAQTTPNVVVCKSLSKVYALSGARAAYLTTSPSRASALRRVTPPWVIGLVAQVAAVEALGDPRYYRSRYDETHSLRSALAADLFDAGFEVIEGRTNSILCRIESPRARQLVDAARDRGCFVRDISTTTSRPTHDMIRVAVKDAATNARTIVILSEAKDLLLQNDEGRLTRA
jgi:histidinol-phosphate/aromatic aminotransferase/cobyric acid decarboxylase-like protein